MKVFIKAECIDKYTGAVYPYGAVIEVTDERGAEMLESGCVTEVTEAKPKRKKKA